MSMTRTVRRGYVDGRWGQVHYRTAGEAGPAVVLLHESPSSSAHYEPVMELLAADLRTFAFDTPGYGASDPPPSAQEIPGYAGALLEAVDGLGIDRFLLVGSHTGAGLALQVAAQADEARVIGAVVSGVPVYTDEERDAFLASWAPEQQVEPDGSHLQWAWDRTRRTWGADVGDELLHAGTVDLLRVLQRYTWAYNASFRHPALPDVQAMTAPTLVLSAEHDMLAEMDRRAVAHLPRGRLEVVPGIPGGIQMRSPEVLARAIRTMVGPLA